MEELTVDVRDTIGDKRVSLSIFDQLFQDINDYYRKKTPEEGDSLKCQ